MTSSAAHLTIRRCQNCGTLSEAAAMFCANCLERSFEEIVKPGNGVLASWTTIRKPPLAFKELGPYEVAVVDLEVGLRVTGHLLPESKPSIGQPVELVEQQVIEGKSVNVFRVVE